MPGMPGMSFPGMPMMPGYGAGRRGMMPSSGQTNPDPYGVISAGWYGDPYMEALARERQRQAEEESRRAQAYQQTMARARYRPVGSSAPDPSAYLPQLMGLMFGGGGGAPRRGFGDF